MLRSKKPVSDEYVPVRPYFNVVVRPKAPPKRAVNAALQTVPQAVIERYAAGHEVDKAKATRLWRELVRFLLLTAANPTRRYGMYGPVDGMWHDFILHTQLYAAFCEAHIGRFMHHSPSRTMAGARWESRYLQFLFDYRDIYGEPPPDDLWPIPPVRGIDPAALPKKASAVTPGQIKIVFETLNGALQGTALGKLPGHKTIKRRKSRKGNADGSGAGCSGGGGDSHDAGGDAGGCGSGGCGGGGCGS
jgi:uncharacterized membrane protein YgcG